MALSGWKTGNSKPIGTSLAKKDYLNKGVWKAVVEDYGALAVPPIDPFDYPVPPMPCGTPLPGPCVPLSVGIVMLATRDDSRADQFMEQQETRGIGRGTRAWADQLSLAWYGKPYADLNQTQAFGEKSVEEMEQRANIRAAMGTVSWPAWLAINATGALELERNSRTGTVTAEVSAAFVGALAVAFKTVPVVSVILGIISAALAVTGLIIAKAAEDTMDLILGQMLISPASLSPADAETMCAVASIALDRFGHYALASSPEDPATAAIVEAGESIMAIIEDPWMTGDVVAQERTRQLFSNCPGIVALRDQGKLEPRMEFALFPLTPPTPDRLPPGAPPALDQWEEERIEQEQAELEVILAEERRKKKTTDDTAVVAVIGGSAAIFTIFRLLAR